MVSAERTLSGVKSVSQSRAIGSADANLHDLRKNDSFSQIISTSARNPSSRRHARLTRRSWQQLTPRLQAHGSTRHGNRRIIRRASLPLSRTSSGFAALEKEKGANGREFRVQCCCVLSWRFSFLTKAPAQVVTLYHVRSLLVIELSRTNNQASGDGESIQSKSRQVCWKVHSAKNLNVREVSGYVLYPTNILDSIFSARLRLHLGGGYWLLNVRQPITSDANLRGSAPQDPLFKTDGYMKKKKHEI